MPTDEERPSPAPLTRGSACSRAACGRPARWTPVFLYLPPDSYLYTGPPIRIECDLVLCEEHRVWFVEVGWRELADSFADVPRKMGRPVDDAKTTFELLEVGSRG